MKETRQEAVGDRREMVVGEVRDSTRNDDDGFYKAQLMENQTLEMKEHPFLQIIFPISVQFA